MSKLAHVRKSLEENPNIVIVIAPEENHLPERSVFSHTVDFYIAPKENEYDAKKLQKLLDSLILGLKPTCQDEFSDRGATSDLGFGYLCFDEVIGKEVVRTTTVLTITEPELLTPGGLIICDLGRRAINQGRTIVVDVQEVLRRTWVRLFPDRELALNAYNGKNRHFISKEDLAKHRDRLNQGRSNP